MFGLPAGFETDFLCRRTLDAICIQSNVIHLYFSEECVINIEGGPSEGGLSLNEGELLDPPASILHVYLLLGQTVVSASSCVHGKPCLLFEKGHTLHVHDTSGQYESYSIYVNGKMVASV